MQKKSKAHEGLTLLAHKDGILPAIVMDGSKERRPWVNFRGLGIHVKQTELDSPWQNATGGIRETKCGSGRKSKEEKPGSV